MKPKVIVYTKMFSEVLQQLQEHFHVVELDPYADDFQHRIESELGDVQGIIGDGLQVDQELLDKAPQLKVVSNISVGYDNLDLEAMTEAGVIGTHTPGVLTESTADLIFGLLLATARRIPQLDHHVKQGKWQRPLESDLFSWDVHHKTLGIIGMGRIGQAIARRGHFGFQMPILYHKRRRDQQVEQELNAEYCDLDTLLEQSDFVCLMTPLTQETEGMIGQREFARMKKGAIFINASRGKTVDEEALVQALQNEEITAAGLDVYHNEPINEDHPLLKMDHVVTLPHAGPDTYATRYKMDEVAASNLINALKGKRPAHALNV